MKGNKNIVKYPWKTNPCSPESFYSLKESKEPKENKSHSIKVNENKGSMFIKLNDNKTSKQLRENKSDEYRDEYTDIFKDL